MLASGEMTVDAKVNGARDNGILGVYLSEFIDTESRPSQT
jgi:hypothetical protein